MKSLIKIASPDDAENLTTIAARLFKQTYLEPISGAAIKSYIENNYQIEKQVSELENPNIVSLLVYCDGQLVGFSQIRRNRTSFETPQPCDIQLWRIYLDKSIHGKGIAKLLLDQIVEVGARMNGTGLWLAVWDQNKRAIAFYQKHGFEAIGIQPFEIGLEIQNDLVLRLSLSDL